MSLMAISHTAECFMCGGSAPHRHQERKWTTSTIGILRGSLRQLRPKQLQPRGRTPDNPGTSMISKSQEETGACRVPYVWPPLRDMGIGRYRGNAPQWCILVPPCH